MRLELRLARCITMDAVLGLCWCENFIPGEVGGEVDRPGGGGISIAVSPCMTSYSIARATGLLKGRRGSGIGPALAGLCYSPACTSASGHHSSSEINRGVEVAAISESVSVSRGRATCAHEELVSKNLHDRVFCRSLFELGVMQCRSSEFKCFENAELDEELEKVHTVVFCATSN